jgi:hypothetical protein
VELVMIEAEADPDYGRFGNILAGTGMTGLPGLPEGVMRVWDQVAVGWAMTVPAAGPSCHCKETDQVARFTVTKPLTGGRTLDARNDPADFLQDTHSDLAGPDAPDPVE